MGNMCSGDTGGNGEELQKSREIDAQLKRDRATQDKEVKLLLLGAGESGKSTIVKQMKIIHQEGYTRDERLAFREVIFSNTVQSMKVMIAACENLGIDFEKSTSKSYADEIAQMPIDGMWTAEVGNMIKSLWADRGIQQAYERKSEFQLNDSAQYYFENIDRLIDPDYVPNEQDVLRSRVRTTGIVETQFSFGGMRFRMYDVGGQRNERRKWIHAFDSVTAVIFVVGISEYDQKLYEDESQNRMKESLLLFDEICNSRWFIHTSMILFLNKRDLFETKFVQRKIPLTICFPDYDGPFELESGSAFIKAKFTSLNKSEQKTVYPHLTCATDTKAIEVVFGSVKDTILQNNLRDSGFL